MTKPDDIAYLPIEAPPEGWRLADYITASAEDGRNGRLLRVLGPPVPAPPALSPEARAVLEAAARFGRGECDSTMLKHAAHDYAATLTPPDLLEEARKALDEVKRLGTLAAHTFPDGFIEKMEAALARLAEKKDPAA